MIYHIRTIDTSYIQIINPVAVVDLRSTQKEMKTYYLTRQMPKNGSIVGGMAHH